VVSTLIIFLIRQQPVDRPISTISQGGIKLSRQHLGFLVIVFGVMFATYLPQPLSSNFLQNVHDLTFGQIGQLGSIASLGIVVLSLTLGHLSAYWGFLLAQVAIGVFAFSLWRGQNMAWFLVGYFLLGGYRVARTMATAQTRSLVHQGNMGLAYGITEMVSSSAIILAPPLAGYLYSKNPSLMYPISLGLILITLAASACFALRSGMWNIVDKKPKPQR
jgi:hypothetical protein